jgi:hypothetical protein
MNERRTSTERRVEDNGPPSGCCERRKRAERRLPIVEESKLSADDFVRYFAAATKGENVSAHQCDHAAAVFDRVSKR